SARAAPADRPGHAAAAPSRPTPSRPTRSRRALAAADVADFFFAGSQAGRALMRPLRGARYRVCFASTPIDTAPTLPRVHLFGRQLARARGVPRERAAPADRPGADRPGRTAAPTDPL